MYFMKPKKKICVICKKEFDEWGNNAWPVAEGTCCDHCNTSKVIPKRVIAHKAGL